MKTAEEILKEYVKFDDVNQSKTVELLPLTIVDAMEEYAEIKISKYREVMQKHIDDQDEIIRSLDKQLKKE